MISCGSDRDKKDTTKKEIQNDKDTLRQRNKVKQDTKRKQLRIMYRNVHVELNDVKYEQKQRVREKSSRLIYNFDCELYY